MNPACPECSTYLYTVKEPVPIEETDENRIGVIHFCSEVCRDLYVEDL